MLVKPFSLRLGLSKLSILLVLLVLDCSFLRRLVAKWKAEFSFSLVGMIDCTIRSPFSILGLQSFSSTYNTFFVKSPLPEVPIASIKPCFDPNTISTTFLKSPASTTKACPVKPLKNFDTFFHFLIPFWIFCSIFSPCKDEYFWENEVSMCTRFAFKLMIRSLNFRCRSSSLWMRFLSELIGRSLSLRSGLCGLESPLFFEGVLDGLLDFLTFRDFKEFRDLVSLWRSLSSSLMFERLFLELLLLMEGRMLEGDFSLKIVLKSVSFSFRFFWMMSLRLWPGGDLLLESERGRLLRSKKEGIRLELILEVMSFKNERDAMRCLLKNTAIFICRRLVLLSLL